MHSWKDKVTDKLTNLFSHSPSSSPPHGSPSPHKARSHTKDGGYFSSVLTFMRSSTEPTSNKYDNHLKPIQSLPTRWNSKDGSWQHIPLTTYDDDDDDFNPREKSGTQSSLTEVSTAKEENGDQGSAGSTSSSSEVFEDATEPNTPMRAVIDITIDSSFISPDLYQFFQASLPNIVKGCRWVLLYSTLKHGISLRTLIRKSSDLSGPCLLITGDTQGAVFGGLLNGPLTPTPKRKYQGTHETFVFTTLYGAPRLFRPTGANRYFYMCLNDLLALGGGGNFALRLDGDLLSGTSGRCDTFGNQCLAHDESFALKNVELWGFTHSSRYP
ncbi:putative TLDc domain-containing protein [Helianthus annuus]|uniref:Putative TLD-domain containing nucleolar protein n=1 Tax=Helianthus annuus TaxID=4232 RepID=A0A251VR35_HELAN|nr:oxidation resistance protein 1 [Helianthus annuus]KAF5823104.1 putative TLDc domain-containing protein [Helianthus annuus]KAJ0627859.1 putative TLDc domain-containing protein [Helianthus annuus]KAJ0949143.1 putative TLDc domain-containing protein [Helianthus annuus]